MGNGEAGQGGAAASPPAHTGQERGRNSPLPRHSDKRERGWEQGDRRRDRYRDDDAHRDGHRPCSRSCSRSPRRCGSGGGNLRPGAGPDFMLRNLQQQRDCSSRRDRPRSRSRERRGRRSPPRSSAPGPALPPAGGAAASTSPAAVSGFVRSSVSGVGCVAPATIGLSVDQKRKLLWGGKKKEAVAGTGAGDGLAVAGPTTAAAGGGAAPGTATAAPASASVFGRNRWDQAEFGSEQERLRFIKLMGGKAAAEKLQQGAPVPVAPKPVHGPALPGQEQEQQPVVQPGAATAVHEGAAVAADAPDIMKRERQAQVLSELERGFQAGLRRQLASNRTVGLGL